MAHNKKIKPRKHFNHANIVKNKKRIEKTEKLVSKIKNEIINN
jgi:hypothetical protein